MRYGYNIRTVFKRVGRTSGIIASRNSFEFHSASALLAVFSVQTSRVNLVTTIHPPTSSSIMKRQLVSRTMDPGIVCFQHCGPKIFCFTLPERCPACGGDLSKANFSLLPFRVPYPFVRASQYPCAVVIKPTSGDFLNDYYNSMDLHIGVTTSTGTIVEFDKNGLRRHRSGHWGQCLLLDKASSPWIEHWDNTLTQVCKQKCWSPRNYSEDRHNCYTFVLSFLRNLDYGNLSEAASSRTAFCEKFIVPRTTSAGKYISLYRKLKEFGFYIHKSNNYK